MPRRSRDDERIEGGGERYEKKNKEKKRFFVDVDLGVGVEILIGSGCE